MIVTCWRISDRLKGGQKRSPTSRLKHDDADEQHDDGDRRRVAVQEVLQPTERRAMVLLELGDGVAGVQHRSNS